MTTARRSSPFFAILRGLAAPFSVIAEARSRRLAYERLNRLSDAQLADRGLSRGTILAHVFSDRVD